MSAQGQSNVARSVKNQLNFITVKLAVNVYLLYYTCLIYKLWFSELVLKMAVYS